MLGFLAGALTFLALAVPASAFAQGTYTWNLASDFTATPPGANPDHDPYGAIPWTYVEGASSAPSSFTPLPTFATGVDGGLAAWNDASTGALVGINPTGSPITSGSNTFAAGQIVLQPGSAGQVVAVGWTSPLSQTEQVTINGTVSADSSAQPLCANTTYDVVDQNGNSLLPPGTSPGTTPGTFSLSASVSPGATIYVTVSTPPVDAFCDATGLSLQIQAPGVAPTVTLTQPAAGSSTTLAEPTFSGAADAEFGDSGQVAVLIYAGAAASGTPMESVVVARDDTPSGSTWSATLTSPLALGTYTAEAEQVDVVDDVGLSAPITFTIGTPFVTLTPPGATLSTSTPVLTGTAGTAADEAATVKVVVYPGPTASGSPITSVSAPVATSGQFSVEVALSDGTYTAVATQGDLAGNTGISVAQTFSVDTQPPTVTLARPAKGARSDALKLVFNGAAGSAFFDSKLVSVALYKGSKASGKRYGTVTVKVTGTTWTATWPGKLPPAQYTAQASQTDVVGHIGRSLPHTFRVIPPPPVIGKVTINPGGRVNLKLTCNEPAGDNCSGTVLVLTQGNFQPLPGGPVGRLTVMFAFVKVPAGQTSVIARTVQPRVAAALHRRPAVPVTISTTLHPLTGNAIRATARENLQRL